MLESYPALKVVVETIDEYLEDTHPSYFGSKPIHPVLPLKRSKVLHDNLWGTNPFSWRELALIDSPVIQRLRDIHQIGLALQTYMCARHSRFEHSIGVVTIASRVFDSIRRRNGSELGEIARVLYPDVPAEKTILRLKEEMRLAALLHDTGHSLYSHTSERVYSQLPMIKAASVELSRIVGKAKGAGEVLAFCLALSNSVINLLKRAEGQVIGESTSDDYDGQVDLIHVALLIVGRGPHPYLQFLGDIVSSGFDADKLDYLFRDAAAAGLPLRYDLDRYLYSVRLEKNVLVDGEGELNALYSAINAPAIERKPKGGNFPYDYFETYRLRLPKEAMNTIEQLVLCKLMLFSYIYHHTKVRAAEGLLERLLARAVEVWKSKGKKDSDILKWFLDATDASLYTAFKDLDDPIITDHAYRIINRLLPREVYGISGADGSHAEAALLTTFLTDLQKRKRSAIRIHEFEKLLGEELKRLRPELAHETFENALAIAGVWLDVPKMPKIEDVEDIVIGGVQSAPTVPLTRIFPVGEWTEAYTHYKYQVRVFSFSEYRDSTAKAARKAMEAVTGISGADFFQAIERQRR